MNGVGNKAIASTGAIGLSAQLVLVGLWLAGASPPQEIVVAIQGILTVVLTYAAVYWAPYNPPPAKPAPPEVPAP